MASDHLSAEYCSRDHLLVNTEGMKFSPTSPQLSLCGQSLSLILWTSLSFLSGLALLHLRIRTGYFLGSEKMI